MREAAERLVEFLGEDMAWEPAEPTSIEDTGLSTSFLSDLALKVLYGAGSISGYEIAAAMGLPFVNVVDQVLEHLRREHLCEVTGSGGGLGESAYQYVISTEGRIRGREVMDRNQYVGPAPVPLDKYAEGVKQQSLQNTVIEESTIREGVAHLVLREETLGQLGPAINSGRSIFLFGPPGNGKTAVATSIGEMLPGNIYVPYAVHIEGHIVKVFDLHNHQPVEEDETPASVDRPGVRRGKRYDKRWRLVRRPTIIVGGELTMESLDLVYDPVSKTHEAPFQMKANGGMFLIDDFGRQQVRPRDLLNRWIMPLERRIDYLTLQTGKKIEIPFDLLIVFSTNLEPRDLVDEAFLRRIRHKIEFTDPTFEDYREIFRRVCEERGVPYDEQALAYLLREYYIRPKVRMRAVHPRDIIAELVDIARYRGVKPVLSEELIDQACHAYFVRL